MKKFKNQGDFLRIKRLEAKISQRDLASMLGFKSTQTISNIERGLMGIPFAHLKRVCEILDIPIAEMRNVLQSDFSADLDLVFEECSS